MTMIYTRRLNGLGGDPRLLLEEANRRRAAEAEAASSGQQLSPALLQEMSATLAPHILSAVQPTPSGDPAGGSPSLLTGSGSGAAAAATADACSCMVDKIAQSVGGALPSEMALQLATACASNPDAIREAARQFGVSLDACKPWYMRKTTWIVGAVVAGVGAWLVLR